MKVTKIVDEDISEKVDINYIKEFFKSIPNVGIIYACTLEGEEEDDWMEDGFRYIVIHLPYKEVKNLADIRPMMLEKAKKKLGFLAGN
jgi:hypothetical protein